MARGWKAATKETPEASKELPRSHQSTSKGLARSYQGASNMLAPHSVYPTMAMWISSSCILHTALQPKALQSHSTLHIPRWTLCAGMAKQRNSPHLNHNPKFLQLEPPFWRRRRDSITFFQRTWAEAVQITSPKPCAHPLSSFAPFSSTQQPMLSLNLPSAVALPQLSSRAEILEPFVHSPYCSPPYPTMLWALATVGTPSPQSTAQRSRVLPTNACPAPVPALCRVPLIHRNPQPPTPPTVI